MTKGALNGFTSSYATYHCGYQRLQKTALVQTWFIWFSIWGLLKPSQICNYWIGFRLFSWIHERWGDFKNLLPFSLICISVLWLSTDLFSKEKRRFLGLAHLPPLFNMFGVGVPRRTGSRKWVEPLGHSHLGKVNPPAPPTPPREGEGGGWLPLGSLWWLLEPVEDPKTKLF